MTNPGESRLCPFMGGAKCKGAKCAMWTEGIYIPDGSYLPPECGMALFSKAMVVAMPAVKRTIEKTLEGDGSYGSGVKGAIDKLATSGGGSLSDMHLGNISNTLQSLSISLNEIARKVGP